jgi:pimeloyl-ACP methyl ester carboxylesterase
MWGVRFALRALLFVGGAWVVISALVYLFQRRLQYFPDRSEVIVPAGERYAGLTEVRPRTEDGVELRAWHWPGSRKTTLLFFHGNAGHRGHRLEWVERFHQLGWGIYLLDYRGYGGSDGSPTEEGLFKDADAARRSLGEQSTDKVIYIGESIGCSVAVDLASRQPPVALVLQSGAISVAEVAKAAYPILPVGLLMKDRFDSREKIAQLSGPVLSIHGDRDRIIPMRLGRELFDAATCEKEWYEVSGAGHNDLIWVGGRPYYERVHRFLERVSGG